MKLLIRHIISVLCLFASCSDAPDTSKAAYIQSIHDQAHEVRQYISQQPSKKYNDSIAILINFKAPSGTWRFFIYDLKQDVILHKGLVAHGSGSEVEGTDELRFFNVPNSLATSLGKYSIGNSYYGDFGKAYKMHGLEASNDKAFERFVVFHAHECVPDQPVKRDICLSWGCPTVSPAFFTTVATYIDASPRRIIMDIIYK